MNRVPATIAIALALAAVPSASIAQHPQKDLDAKAAIGIAMMPGSSKFTSGEVKVMAIRPGGAGAQMGIHAGDVITHAGGKRITMDKMLGYIRKLKVGGPVELTVRRGRKSLELKGTAQARTWR